MSGIPHSTNQERLPLSNLLPAAWSTRLNNPEQPSTIPQIHIENDPIPPSQRLIVILPDAAFYDPALQNRLVNIIKNGCGEVLLINQPGQQDYELFSQLNLATLSAKLSNENAEVTSQVIVGMSVEQAAQQLAQPGDLFVCFEEHLIPGFLKKNRLADILALKTHLPVYTLKGLATEAHYPQYAYYWFRFLGIALGVISMIAFFALEVWIDQNYSGMLHAIFLILAVFAEIWIVTACIKWPRRMK